jgi:hypothetical protein
MRHYAISNIEQVAGYATAAAFAGHRLVRGATASYVKVGLPEVATTFSHLGASRIRAQRPTPPRRRLLRWLPPPHERSLCL